MTPQQLIYQLIEKAIILTTDALNLSQEDQIEEVSRLIAQRDNIFEIFNLTYLRVENAFDKQYKDQLNQLITQVMQMDLIILHNLESQKEKIQIDIAKIFKNKENFKGYNLNTLK